jgi:glycosyltransferase involved in cell wall biosynthesis
MATTKDERPRVSVLVNTYNHQQLLAQALDSIAEQDYPSANIETIVVDDGSTDDTAKIAERYVPQIRLIRKANGGQVSAVNMGAQWCSGEFVAFLDGDDWWRRDKITKIVEAFQKYGDVAAVGHGFYETDEAGRVTEERTLKGECRLDFQTVESARFATRMRTFGSTSKLAVRREVFNRILPLPERLPFFDNFVLFLATASSGAVLLPDPLCFYRLHSGSLYAFDERDGSRLRRRYQLELGLVEELPRRLLDFGASREVIAAVVESDKLSSQRLGLMLDGGWPWQTFQAERSYFRSEYRNPQLGYRLFQWTVLLASLVLPPRLFYRMRDWYAKHNLKRVRDLIGKAVLAVPDTVETVEAPRNRGRLK